MNRQLNSQYPIKSNKITAIYDVIRSIVSSEKNSTNVVKIVYHIVTSFQENIRDLITCTCCEQATHVQHMVVALQSWIFFYTITRGSMIEHVMPALYAGTCHQAAITQTMILTSYHWNRHIAWRYMPSKGHQVTCSIVLCFSNTISGITVILVHRSFC